MESDNFNFNELWSSQKAQQPNKEDLVLKLNNFKKSNRNKIILVNTLLLVTSMAILLIWFFCKPQMVTTKVGIILIVLAIFILVISLSKSFSLFKEANESDDVQQYLKNLISIKDSQRFIQTTMLNLYFLMLSTGIALYMYEYACMMTTFWAIFVYTITGSWILFSWLFFRPRMIRKQQERINDVLSNFERINQQLKDQN